MPNEVGCGDESSYMRSRGRSSRSRPASDDANRIAHHKRDRQVSPAPIYHH